MSIAYDASTDVVTIEGIRYSGEIFRTMATAEIGTWLRVTARAEGKITFSKVAESTERTFDAIAGISARIRA